MNTLEKLIAMFETFPGVGARQARRFAFHVLTLPEADSAELAKLIADLPGSVHECESCHRFFSSLSQSDTHLCRICGDESRDRARLLVVERDSDIQAIERAGSYDGLYFVLGGTVPLLTSPPAQRLRGGRLRDTVATRLEHGLTEVILGFSVNPDGENTARFVHSLLDPIITGTTCRISHLGRGLSTGSELEYADAETLKHALQHRV
ncbi:MAG: toprim domain-containing protein [Patescibacteria group bacterium]